MRCGFKFKNHHSNELGGVVRTKSRPLRPAVKSLITDLPNRDGEYDFTEANIDGREHYESRLFTVSVAFTANTWSELQNKISSLSLWLRGKGDLVFDDIPYVIWKARVFDEVIYSPQGGGLSSVVEVTFRAEPFGRGTFDTTGPALSSLLPIDSYIPLSLDEMYIYTLNRRGDIKVFNFGDAPVRPVIDIQKGSGGVRIVRDTKSLFFTSSGGVRIDFQKQLILDGNGNQIEAGGDFFELGEGENTLQIQTDVNGEIVLTVAFTPQYFYSVSYEENKWGE